MLWNSRVSVFLRRGGRPTGRNSRTAIGGRAKNAVGRSSVIENAEMMIERASNIPSRERDGDLLFAKKIKGYFRAFESPLDGFSDAKDMISI